jgi:hypothetical protein
MHVQHDWPSGPLAEIEIGFEVAEQRRIFANVSGRPSLRGSRRWPCKKSSSMNLS